MRRASMQTRSVDLWRDLQELQTEEAGAAFNGASHSPREAVCRVLPAHPEGRIVGELA